jgi:hypothetical protein
MARAQIPEDSIIVYGRSLGTGVAAGVAAFQKPSLLILETPYYSMAELFSHYAPVYPTERMSNYKLPTYKFLQDVTSRVIIFHGKKDEVIPYKHAIKLKALLKAGDKFITIDEGKHNNLSQYKQFTMSMDSLLTH